MGFIDGGHDVDGLIGRISGQMIPGLYVSIKNPPWKSDPLTAKALAGAFNRQVYLQRPLDDVCVQGWLD